MLYRSRQPCCSGDGLEERQSLQALLTFGMGNGFREREKNLFRGHRKARCCEVFGPTHPFISEQIQA